ncbi:hypothetical protein BDA96_03G037400 [Sorghum bicolor]|uniref:Uncharacterized protein n=1 Tax=Sorghum bicolor TaxID=4558 RepID=A0A921R9U6_SORBI|nr:hypothetical protein BDA96_03G037400 [Sorghum bicolor]
MTAATSGWRTMTFGCFNSHYQSKVKKAPNKRRIGGFWFTQNGKMSPLVPLYSSFSFSSIMHNAIVPL